MEAGDFVLVGGEGFYRRHSLLMQDSGPLDCLPGVTHHAPALSLAVRKLPAEFLLLPLLARLRPAYRRFTAAETLRAQSQQLTRPLDGLQRALLKARHNLAQRPPALIQFPFAFIDLALTLAERRLPPVSLPLPHVGLTFPLVSPVLPLISQCLAFVGSALALIRRALALIRRAFARTHRLTLS